MHVYMSLSLHNYICNIQWEEKTGIMIYKYSINVFLAFEVFILQSDKQANSPERPDIFIFT